MCGFLVINFCTNCLNVVRNPQVSIGNWVKRPSYARHVILHLEERWIWTCTFKGWGERVCQTLTFTLQPSIMPMKGNSGLYNPWKEPSLSLSRIIIFLPSRAKKTGTWVLPSISCIFSNITVQRMRSPRAIAGPTTNKILLVSSKDIGRYAALIHTYKYEFTVYVIFQHIDMSKCGHGTLDIGDDGDKAIV